MRGIIVFRKRCKQKGTEGSTCFLLGIGYSPVLNLDWTDSQNLDLSIAAIDDSNLVNRTIDYTNV